MSSVPHTKDYRMRHDVRDADLVRSAQAGDRAALVALYQRYVQEVYGFFVNQTGNFADAEDLTSETFLRVVRGLDHFAGRSSFRTWLYEIAKNQLRDMWRANGRRPVVDVDVAGLEELSPAARDGTNPAAARLGQAILEALPAHYRRVLELRIMEGRSVRDTAAYLGKSETNIKVLTHRALKRAEALASELGEKL